jgi:hypothetical protein
MNTPADDNDIITHFKPADGQWELTDDNINRIDPDSGETILHNYCQYINTTPIEVYKHLIETKGCDINSYDGYNYTPLYWALLEFQATKCNENGYIGGGVGDNLSRDSSWNGSTDGHGGDINTLMYLLHHEGNVNNNNTNLLLHKACNNINSLPLAVFKYLIEIRGLKICSKDDYHDTPLDVAFLSFNPRESGDINILRYLLQQDGVNVDNRDNNNCTLLHQACCCINTLPLEIFKYLIEVKGGDINAQDIHNNTPLDTALRWFMVSFDNIHTLMYLFNLTKNPPGSTLLHKACININTLPIDIFKLLIETHRVSLNTKDKDGNTPLCYVFDKLKTSNDIHTFTYLLNQKDITLDVTCQHRYTLLHKIVNSKAVKQKDAVFGLKSKNAPILDPLFDKNDWSVMAELLIERFISQIIGDSTM